MQQGRIRHMAQRWDVSMIWAEANSAGSVNIERLREMDLPVRPFQTTATSKAPLIEGLAMAIEQRELALLNDPVLLHELAMYGMERTASGGYRYGAPSGEHDDTVIAAALAWHGVKNGGLLIDFV